MSDPQPPLYENDTSTSTSTSGNHHHGQKSREVKLISSKKSDQLQEQNLLLSPKMKNCNSVSNSNSTLISSSISGSVSESVSSNSASTSSSSSSFVLPISSSTTLDDFEAESRTLLGAGAHGVVYKYIRKKNRKEYVIKVISLEKLNAAERVDAVNETLILSSIKR